MGSVGFLLKLSACILIFLILGNFCVTCQIQTDPLTIAANSFTRHFIMHFKPEVHFYWGTQNSNGAEHTIDGIRYAMEKNEKKTPFTTWDIVANHLKEIPEKGNSVDLNRKVSVGSLWKKTIVDKYYFYKGSRTFPPLSGGVKWIIIRKCIVVSSQVHEKFISTLYFTTMKENRPMQNHFRPLQPLNDRKVFYYTEHKSVRACINLCIARLF